MVAALHLVTGPVASGKTRRLLARYQALAAEGGACLWLAPGERACDALRSQLPASSGTAPNVLTFPEFASRIVRAAEPNARWLPELHQRLLLDEALAELAGRGEVPLFAALADSRGFADAMFGLLTELKGQGVSPPTFATTARQLDGAVREKAGQVAAVFGHYQGRLDGGRWFDRQSTYVRAREVWAAGRPGPFAGVRAVFVDGFADFTPPQLELLTAVGEMVDEIWIAILTDRSGDEPRAELFCRPLATVARLRGLRGPASQRRATEAPNSAAGLCEAGSGSASRPAGLGHLERSLFRSEPLPSSTDADGLAIIEAPGLLGEVRLVARAIKTLLLDGTPAGEIMVTARDLGGYADLVCEVFAEYGIPADVDGTVPLIRNPAVATLLRAVRLADDGFPFAATTSLLRNTYLRPPWPEVEADADVATHAEILLRLLGESQGKEAYLRAARLWAAEPQPGLEDEDAEEPHRRRKHDLAKRCLPFLERFFRAWDALPQPGELADFVDRLRAFAADIGLDREAERTDAAAWSRFWTELDALRAVSAGEKHPARRADPLRLVSTAAASVGVPRSESGPGRVRVLPAEQARHVDCDHLFLLGLGERGFPDLSGGPLFDDVERDALRTAGLPVRCAADRLPDEMLLFYQIITRARRRLVLSYPAVDDKGQSLLPGSFLTACRECFVDGAISVTRQRMLIEGYHRLRPLSPAEFRVRWAAGGSLPIDAPQESALAADLVNHLDDARAMARARFRSRAFSPYDGLLRSPGVIDDLRDRFGAEKVFSPTALEHYVACPFRFFLEDVLDLEPLEDPAEEVEHTRRGAAVHRALARLHRRLDAEGVDAPSAELTGQYVEELRAAVEEYAARVSSAAAKALWRLEGQRLERAAARYPSHWSKFQKPWQEQKLVVRPFRFEVDFGLGRQAGDGPPLGPLVIRHDDVEVRIGGRIDRVDVAELDDGTVGFWVIDYKTGRSGYYTGTDLASLKKLQLPLYALAVEALLLQGGRPLGFAYWMVTDAGAKVALPRRPTAWLSSGDDWPRFRDHLERWVAKLAGLIRGGEFPLKPRSPDCTSTCPYGEACRIAEARAVEKDWDFPLPVLAAGGGDE